MTVRTPIGPLIDPDALPGIYELPQDTTPHPWAENPELIRGRGKPRDPSSVPGILRALKPGESHLFTQYKLSSQLGQAVAAAMLDGGRFKRSRELSLIDGQCIGVRVTRIE